MGTGIHATILRLARRFGLAFFALALLAAPLGSVGHAAASESPHHAVAAHGQGAGALCDMQHGDNADKSGALGSDCCLSFCHVVSGPIAAPLGDPRPVAFPRSAGLSFADVRAPSGLLLKPPLDPPRSNA
jgi:hypothetical protein